MAQIGSGSSLQVVQRPACVLQYAMDGNTTHVKAFRKDLARHPARAAELRGFSLDLRESDNTHTTAPTAYPKCDG